MHGVKIGNWLTQQQAQQLLDEPDLTTLKGKRDRALFSVMIGCALRRDETARLTFEQIQQREGRWVIVDLLGKGGRVRTVPIPAWAKAAIDRWSAAADIHSGHVFRPVNKGGRLAGDRMSAQAFFHLTISYADTLGLGKLAPHDLRRTFAKLGRKAGSALEQIQWTLGHASIQTTERYVGIKQDLHDAPGDRLGLH
jgi:integrase